nr:hypothetical protein [Tanacetum cinerariifolium]
MENIIQIKKRIQAARDRKKSYADRRLETVAYQLELPKQLSRLHSTFHVSNLKKCFSDEPLAIPLDEIQIDDKLNFIEEPVEIIDLEVKQLKKSRILIVKVCWNSRRGPEFTWEREDQMKKKGEYSQWRERFMNYLEEQTDGEAMINSIQNGDQPLPVIAQVSLAENAQNAPPTLKDPKFWTTEEKKTRKIDRLTRSLLIQGLSNDIYSLIDSNETAKDFWDDLERQMCGSEYGQQDRRAAILMKTVWYTDEANQEPNRHLDALYNILKKNQGDVNDALGYKKKAIVVTSDPLALVAEKMKVSKRKEKVVVSSNYKGSGADDFCELKKITALLAKAFNRRKFYSKPTNNNLRTSSTSQSANKKQEFV